jgi:hypothetical protein
LGLEPDSKEISISDNGTSIHPFGKSLISNSSFLPVGRQVNNLGNFFVWVFINS